MEAWFFITPDKGFRIVRKVKSKRREKLNGFYRFGIIVAPSNLGKKY
jgi:hypothetical protein